MTAAFFAGLGLGASLIIAIGAQNAFVLRQGLLRCYALTVAALCTLIDWTLIAAGAVGFGVLVERVPAFTSVAAWGGALFLFGYGLLSFRRAMKPGTLEAGVPAGRAGIDSYGAAVLTTFAVSLLNPHVYLDTVVLLGSVASQYAIPERVVFVIGAGVASAAWFFGLAVGARLLAPLFETERSWRVLDIAIGIVMWLIAAGLVRGELGF